MTLEPNMFTQAAVSGKAQLVPDPANGFVKQVIAALGATPAAVVSATGPNDATALVHFDLAIPDTATATYIFKTNDAIEIVDVIVRKSGAGAGNTLQLTDAVDAAITNAMAAAVDKTITRAGTIDPAKNKVAAGGTFKAVATNNAGSLLMDVTVVCRRT